MARGGEECLPGQETADEAAVVVKEREYQGNVFGGFRRSAAMTIATGGEPLLFCWPLVVAAAVAVVAVVTEVRRRKAKSWAPMVQVISCIRPHAMPAFVANP